MEKLPDGVWFERTADGFRLRAPCRSFTDTVTRVGLAAVVSWIPFKLWWDLIRNFWSDQGLSFWLTAGFLTIWGAAIVYVDTIALVSLFGAVRVARRGDSGEIFTGIGKLGWTHRLTWSDFDGASGVTVQLDSDRPSSKSRYVVLRGPAKRYKFGWQLPLERQGAIIAALNEHVFTRGQVG